MTAVRQMLISPLTFWLILCGISLYSLLPLRDSLRLGMDLAGGTYLTLEVQVDKAVEAELVERLHFIEDKLKTARLAMPTEKKVEATGITLTYGNAQQAQEVALFLRDELQDLEQLQEGKNISLSFTANKVQLIKDDAVSRNIGVLRTRLDPYGAAEIAIAQQGEKNIIIELPDVAKTLETKARIGKSAQLDFRLVEKSASSKEDLLLEFDGDLPSDKEILPSKTKGGTPPTYYLVSRFTDITGKSLKEASPNFGGQSGVEPVMSFTLNPEGARRFYDLTSKNIGRVVAIVLDGVVISAGQIKDAIRDKGQISGSFRDIKEARELALLLQSGAYVAPVTFEEERQIGPSLGSESIRKGFISCVVGLALVLLFSLFYYGLAGLLAFLALLFNLVLILLGLSWLRATLTLPGIAGMVLTVGMAIDASILIFERIREELVDGTSLKNAVSAGFSGAMRVILDANVTTFIVGIVLYNAGSGPIQGFAVTMMLGIVATLITGLFFLRSLFSFILNNFNVQKMGI